MQEINASIITIGDELLIGQTIDTNSAFIATELNNIGIWIKRRVAVGDVRAEILNALEEESKKAQVVIITGGLGPTVDDITKPALRAYFASEIVINEAALENVKNIFSRLNKTATPNNLKQAEVPHNCTVLPNNLGTAPGMWFEKDGVVYISLPGVPHEMQGLIKETVIGKLKQHFTLPTIVHKTLLTAGKGETEIADKIKDFEAALPPHIKLAYLPAYGMVKLRLTARGSDAQQVNNEVEIKFGQLKQLVKDWMVSDTDKTIQDVLGDVLAQNKRFVATAESCTGGYIAHLLTARPGSSNTFKGGVVSYANDAKEKALGVTHQTLITHGAVSEETVTEMARGVLEVMNADYAIATSGIMGPDGGTKQKPVGTVWIAVANRQKVKTVQHFVRFDRKKNIEVTAQFALNMLRLFIVEQEA